MRVLGPDWHLVWMQSECPGTLRQVFSVGEVFLNLRVRGHCGGGRIVGYRVMERIHLDVAEEVEGKR